MNAGVMLRDFVAWGPDATGPTRAVALMRIGLATMAIVRFGAEVAPFAAETFSELLLGLVFLASLVFSSCLRIAAGLIPLTDGRPSRAEIGFYLNTASCGGSA